MAFTVEELTVIKMYDEPERLKLIDSLLIAVQVVDDTESMVLIKGLVDKLFDIDDKAFAKIDLSDTLVYQK
jgi:hypothetical protein